MLGVTRLAFRRCMSTAPADFRLAMQKDLLAARKAKDAFKSTVLRVGPFNA